MVKTRSGKRTSKSDVVGVGVQIGSEINAMDTSHTTADTSVCSRISEDLFAVKSKMVYDLPSSTLDDSNYDCTPQKLKENLKSVSNHTPTTSEACSVKLGISPDVNSSKSQQKSRKRPRESGDSVSISECCSHLRSAEDIVTDSSTPRVHVNSGQKVRFCNETQNAVCIIPSLSTTLPFAEQMAKDKQAFNRVAQRSESLERTDDIEVENIVPKCGKIIIGKCFIAIDRFVRKDCCKYHFLTHAHVDHFVNLTKSWKTPVYCSEVTAKILPIMMGKKAISQRLLCPLKVGETHMIEPNLHVTVLDANHCLGSVMFLFEGASIPGGSVLCTGDFRADSRLLSRFENDPSYKKLANTYISKIYFDNTHFNHTDASFPDRTECEKMLMREMEKLHHCNILIPVFRLGREEILEKLSKHYSEVISTSNQRLMVRKLCGLNEGEFQKENDSARIRTSSRQLRQVLQALTKMKEPKVVIDLSTRQEYNGIINESIITIPYSDHSSRTEIIQFLSRLRFGELIPTCAPMDSSTAEELMKLSREVHHSTVSDTSADVQTNSNPEPIKLGKTKDVTSPSSRLTFDFSSFRPADMNVFIVDGKTDLRQYAPAIQLRSPIPSPVKFITSEKMSGQGR